MPAVTTPRITRGRYSRPPDVDVLLVAACAQGLDRTATAVWLGLSEDAVASRLRRLCRRYELRCSQAALVDEFLRRGWLGSLPPMSESAVLSACSAEVLPLVAAGLSNGEIAARLWVAADTVKGRLRRLYGDLGATDRAHAVAIGWQQGFLGRETVGDPSPTGMKRARLEPADVPSPVNDPREGTRRRLGAPEPVSLDPSGGRGVREGLREARRASA